MRGEKMKDDPSFEGTEASDFLPTQLGDHESGAGLIRVPVSLLLLSTAPLLGLAFLSHRMKLGLESPIVVGILRTLGQLAILGAILHPIFALGIRCWWIVCLYVLFMVVLASWEASTRNSKYYFTGMVECVLAALLVNVGGVSLFAFGVILRPTPLWNPQYVIPIVGMLLGNCISGVSLSLNNLLVGLHEQMAEVEVYLAFGANPAEASGRIVREAVRVGAMPMLNSMAVIGIISIPGMMTGQILGGSAPTTAAVYQMLIMILIATCTFGTILAEVSIVRCVAFEGDVFQSQRFKVRPSRQNFLETLAWMGSLFALNFKRPCQNENSPRVTEKTPLAQSQEETIVSPRGKVDVSTLRHGGGTADPESPSKVGGALSRPILHVENLSLTIGTNDSISSLSHDAQSGRRTLFRNLTFNVYAGDVLAVSGPSGVGKSQLLRRLAALSSHHLEEAHSAWAAPGVVLLGGHAILFSAPFTPNQHSHPDWRRQIRYVPQGKLDLNGTPREFIRQVTSFASWRRHDWGRRLSVIGNNLRASLRRSSSASGDIDVGLGATGSNGTLSEGNECIVPTFEELTADCLRLVHLWGLDGTSLDSEWKVLSGGESQRILVAISVASRPRVLLLDESTSALDLEVKLRVERTILDTAASTGMAVIWITHDEDQLQRLSGNDACAPPNASTLWGKRLRDEATTRGPSAGRTAAVRATL